MTFFFSFKFLYLSPHSSVLTMIHPFIFPKCTLWVYIIGADAYRYRYRPIPFRDPRAPVPITNNHYIFTFLTKVLDLSLLWQIYIIYDIACSLYIMTHDRRERFDSERSRIFEWNYKHTYITSNSSFKKPVLIFFFFFF